MQGAYGSIDRLAVLQAVRKHITCLAPLCASQFVRNGTIAVIKEKRRKGVEERATLQCSEGRVAREHIEQRDILPDYWNMLMEVMEKTHQERLVMGIVAYADDFIVSSDGDEADRVWDRTTVALGEIGLEIDQSKSCHTCSGKVRRKHKTWRLSGTRWLLTKRTHHGPQNGWLKHLSSLDMSRR